MHVSLSVCVVLTGSSPKSPGNFKLSSAPVTEKPIREIVNKLEVRSLGCQSNPLNFEAGSDANNRWIVCPSPDQARSCCAVRSASGAYQTEPERRGACTLTLMDQPSQSYRSLNNCKRAHAIAEGHSRRIFLLTQLVLRNSQLVDSFILR